MSATHYLLCSHNPVTSFKVEMVFMYVLFNTGKFQMYLHHLTDYTLKPLLWNTESSFIFRHAAKWLAFALCSSLSASITVIFLTKLHSRECVCSAVVSVSLVFCHKEQVTQLSFFFRMGSMSK